jgi:hypothetical protein
MGWSRTKRLFIAAFQVRRIDGEKSFDIPRNRRGGYWNCRVAGSDAALNFFIMTREDIEDNEPFPALLPSVTVGNRWGGLNLSYVPKTVVRDFANAKSVDPNIGGVFFLQAKIRLDDLFKR